jgi:hypothetical protein
MCSTVPEGSVKLSVDDSYHILPSLSPWMFRSSLSSRERYPIQNAMSHQSQIIYFQDGALNIVANRPYAA